MLLPLLLAVTCDVVTPLSTALREHYVFADAGARMAATIEEHRVAYGQLAGKELAAAVTKDLRSMTNDQHILVRVAEKEPEASAPALPAHRFISIPRVEILDGNIGYLDLRGFERRSAATDAKIAAAFELLKGVDAMVIDLR
ncbi:MAG TPA: hypothetical protein VH087_19925, partial [Thermoanaerobaculia bacterium]|nr:hypothetical protein [Thermoanaerobaculia bacterium]